MINLQDYISKEAPVAEWIGVIGTLSLGILALFGDQVRKIIIRPHLSFQGINAISQATGKGVIFIFRLIIKNDGKAAAKEVRANLTAVEEFDKNKLKSKEEFIPIPLNWTHVNKSERNISREEIAYLDIVQYHDGNYLLCWPGGQRPKEKALAEIDNNKKSILHISFSETDRRLQDVGIEFNPKNYKEIKIIN